MAMTAESVVANCPFCGNDGCFPNSYCGRYWTQCDKCGARGPSVHLGWESLEVDEYIVKCNYAIELWNRAQTTKQEVADGSSSI